jgi:excisionase family DNA binding protein
MVPNSRRQQRSQAVLADQTDSPDRFLTAEEAAEFLGGINPRTIVRWAREGQVPAYPLGEGTRRLWRFRSADLRQWMQSRRRGPVLADRADSGRLFPATDASEQRRFQ